MKGFSLVELMIVLCITGILAAMLVTAGRKLGNKIIDKQQERIEMLNKYGECGVFVEEAKCRKHTRK